MAKIIIICGDTVDLNMGGVGVRSWELARALSEYFQVILAIPNKTSIVDDPMETVSFDLQSGDLRQLCSDATAIITQGFVLHFHPYLRDLGIPIAIDLYDPFLLEGLVWHAGDDQKTWIPAYEEFARVQAELLRAGDFFFCASERQRDYWLGWLHGQKRINPHTYAQDPTLRKLIDLVPFGIPEGKPQNEKPVLKGIHPGIASTDRLILWSGGLWDWLDPLLLIRAMGILSARHPDLKLYFLGTRHPNPTVTGMDMPDRAINLSKELGLYDRSVFFGNWVPYMERGRYLSEADLSVVTHRNHIETHFSFRTRVLDCIWAEIPIVISDGDAISELVQKENIGMVVPSGNLDALVRAIETILETLTTATYQTSFEKVKENFRWKNVIEPLRQFCSEPYPAADKGLYLTDLERVSRDKDAFLQQVIQDKDQFWQAIVDDRDRVIQKYQHSLPFRIYNLFKRFISKA